MLNMKLCFQRNQYEVVIQNSQTHPKTLQWDDKLVNSLCFCIFYNEPYSLTEGRKEKKRKEKKRKKEKEKDSYLMRLL